jgi:hypothetical protein
MLDTAFERFNGDVGNARTWPFPVQFRIVTGATPNQVTRPEGPDMLEEFKVAADELIAGGVDNLRLPRLIPERAGRSLHGAGCDQRASASADGGAHPAKGKEIRNTHLLR